MSESSLDERRFRSILGLYPTGVTAITSASGPSSEPVAMVVGTFSSVSLDPPLVSFMPARNSKSYERLKKATSFCVNVLSGSQEDVCRSLSVKDAADKFSGIAHQPSPGGNPVIDGCIAWIECDVWQIVAAGDHDIVIGQVTAMGEASDSLPLLFLAGGYGRFSPHSRVMPATGDLTTQLRLADLARDHLERCAVKLGLECGLVAPVEDSVVRIASAGAPDARGRPALVGVRLPFGAPIGALLVAWRPEDVQRRWIQRGEPNATEAIIQDYLSALRRVRQLGRTVTPRSVGFEEIDKALASSLVESSQVPGLVERSIGAAVFDPPMGDADDDEYPVHNVAVPVFGDGESIPMYVTASALPSTTKGSRIAEIAVALQETSAAISRDL